MGPIFEEPASAAAPPGRTIDERPVLNAETRESGQVMRPDKHVDAVDLMEAEPFDRSVEMTGIDQSWPRVREPLCGEGNPTGLYETDALDSHVASVQRE